MKNWLKRYAKWLSLSYFFQHSHKIIRILQFFFLIFFVLGIMGGLFIVPKDYQQGDAFRIIYMHVPSAVLSLTSYTFLAWFAFVHWVWRIKLFDILAESSAKVGILFTTMALLTGALWGKPMWGTWWIWDPRLTSELILWCLLLGYVFLREILQQNQQSVVPANMMALVGFINVPIIHYSVYWWNSLHQGATLLKWGRPSIPLSMLWPLIIMIMAFFMLYFILLLLQLRSIIAEEIHRGV